MVPLLVDPSNKGHNRNNLSTKDASYGPKCLPSHSTNTFSTSIFSKWLVPNVSFIRRFHCQSDTLIGHLRWAPIISSDNIAYLLKSVHVNNVLIIIISICVYM